MSETMACRVCGNNKPITSEYFRTYVRNNGIRFYKICRACEYERNAKYNKEHESAIKSYRVAWYKDNKEHHNTLTKSYYELNKEKVLRHQRERYQNHRDEINIKHRVYYIKNRKQRLAKNKEWRLSHREYYRAHSIQREHIRRCLYNGTQVENIRPYLIELKSSTVRKCYWCDKTIAGATVTTEHFIPITRGGAHVIRNIVPACWGCNTSRGNKLPEEYVLYKIALGEPLSEKFEEIKRGGKMVRCSLCDTQMWVDVSLYICPHCGATEAIQ